MLLANLTVQQKLNKFRSPLVINQHEIYRFQMGVTTQDSTSRIYAEGTTKKKVWSCLWDQAWMQAYELMVQIW